MRTALIAMLVVVTGCGRNAGEQAEGRAENPPLQPAAAPPEPAAGRPAPPDGKATESAGRPVAAPKAVRPVPVEYVTGGRPSDAAFAQSAAEVSDLRGWVAEYSQNRAVADEFYRGKLVAVWPCWVVDSARGDDGRLTARIGIGETTAVAVCTVAPGKDADEFKARVGKGKAVAIVGTAAKPRDGMPVLVNARAVFIGSGRQIGEWLDAARR